MSGADYLEAVDGPPAQAALEVMDRLTTRLQEAEGVAATGKETNAAANAIASLAADADNPTKVFDRAISACSDVAQRAQTAKQTIIDPIEERQAEVIAETDGGPSLDHGFAFDRYLEEHLEEVKIVDTTDATADVEYYWVVDDGPEVVTEGSTHTHIHEFWAEVEKSTDKKLLPELASTRLIDDLTEENLEGYRERSLGPDTRPWHPKRWTEWVTGLLQTRGRQVTAMGSRTQAVEAVCNYIERSKAVGDKQDAITETLIYAEPADPDEEDPTEFEEIAVPSREVVAIAEDDFGVSSRGLQLELAARGATHPDLPGEKATEVFGADNQTGRFWRLDPSHDDIPTPKEYLDSIEGPTEGWGGNQ